MKKKISILLFLVILPIVLIQVYTFYFEFAGNWLEVYRNYFKIGFLAISVFSTGWLTIKSKKDKSYVWCGFSVILCLLLAIYMYFAIAVINSSY